VHQRKIGDRRGIEEVDGPEGVGGAQQHRRVDVEAGEGVLGVLADRQMGETERLAVSVDGGIEAGKTERIRGQLVAPVERVVEAHNAMGLGRGGVHPSSKHFELQASLGERGVDQGLEAPDPVSQEQPRLVFERERERPVVDPGEVQHELVDAREPGEQRRELADFEMEAAPAERPPQTFHGRWEQRDGESWEDIGVLREGHGTQRRRIWKTLAREVNLYSAEMEASAAEGEIEERGPVNVPQDEEQKLVRKT
jgi:hypothetical protein